jgi:hypothetical protein
VTGSGSAEGNASAPDVFQRKAIPIKAAATIKAKAASLFISVVLS